MIKIDNHRARLYHKSKGEYKFHDIFRDEDGIVYAAVGGGKGLSYVRLYKSGATSNPKIGLSKLIQPEGKDNQLIAADKLGRYAFVGQMEAA